MRGKFGGYRVNPAFDRFPEESRLIGKLLAGFGEIEYLVCHTAAVAGQPHRAALMRALYRLRTTSARFDTADALSRPRFTALKLASQYEIAKAMCGYCTKVRNQYAHGQWCDDPAAKEVGLFFADFRAAAEAHDGFDVAWRHVDKPLLERQEAYFALTMEWLRFLHSSVSTMPSEQGSVSGWPVPPERAPPPTYNPPDAHVPPWLNEDQSTLHLMRVAASQSGAPTPTPGQQALERARIKKRARKQADRDQAK